MKKVIFGDSARCDLLAWTARWAAARIHVMILDGESATAYDNWRAITPPLRKELDETGLFDVDVVTAPTPGAGFKDFKPDWSKYQVVVFNYDAPDERWPADLKAPS